MATLSKENKSAILGTAHLKTETVDVPQWGDGVSVIVSEMSGLARDAFYQRKTDNKGMPISESQAVLLLATVVDDAGSPVFDEADVDALRMQSGTAIDRIAKVAIRLNGLGEKAVEDAAKNSEAGQKSDSGTGSVLTSESQSMS